MTTTEYADFRAKALRLPDQSRADLLDVLTPFAIDERHAPPVCRQAASVTRTTSTSTRYPMPR